MEGLDQTLLGHIIANPSLFPPPPTDLAADVLQVRDRFETTIRRILTQYSHFRDQTILIIHNVKSFDNAEIKIYDIKPKDRAEPAEPERALVYYHGGGNVSCPIDDVVENALHAACVELDVRVFGVEFRYAPEHPYPTPVEDCYAALKWVQDNGQTLNVDPKRIGIYGESGGGNLVAGVALLARDRKLSPPIAKAMMVYPMLDDRATERHVSETSTRDQQLAGFRHSVDLCWEAYLSQKRGQANVPIYASPASAEVLRGFPPTYIDIGTLDVFVQETLEFGGRLVKEDVEVELHMYKGMLHGFDFSAPGIPAVVDAKVNRKRAVWGF